jgi:hypothetical protein
MLVIVLPIWTSNSLLGLGRGIHPTLRWPRVVVLYITTVKEDMTYAMDSQLVTCKLQMDSPLIPSSFFILLGQWLQVTQNGRESK